MTLEDHNLNFAKVLFLAVWVKIDFILETWKSDGARLGDDYDTINILETEARPFQVRGQQV